MKQYLEPFEDKEKRKKIKVGVPMVGEPMLYVNQSGKIDGLAYHVWLEVLKDMEKQQNIKYDVQYIIIEKSNIENLVDGLKTRKYDVVIGDFGIDPRRLNFVEYTAPYMSVKDVGVYLKNTDTSVEYEMFSNIMSLLFYPFVILVLFSIVAAIYAFAVTDKKNATLAGSFVQMMNGILGDRGGLLNGPSFVIRPGKSFFVWIAACLLYTSDAADE